MVFSAPDFGRNGSRCADLPPELEAREARSDFGMVASGSPEATMAGVAILERGGNAVDAAVAAALMLGVSDPDASGLGGITYMLIHLAGGGTDRHRRPQRSRPSRLTTTASRP